MWQAKRLSLQTMQQVYNYNTKDMEGPEELSDSVGLLMDEDRHLFYDWINTQNM